MNKRLFFVLSLTLFATLALTKEHKTIYSNHCAFLDGDCIRSDDWTQVGRASRSERHTIVIAVKKPQSAAATCDSELAQVSNPASPRYGQYYTLEELQTLGLFDFQATHKVQRWLKKHGLENFETSPNGDWIKVSGTVEQLEELLQAKFYNFRSSLSKVVIKRTPSYSLGKKMAEYIDFIGHTVTFPPAKMRIAASKLRDGDGNVTPSLINQVYGISNNMVTNPGATQSLFESLGQDFSQDDLSQFQQNYNLFQRAVDNVIGPNDQTQCSSNPDNCGEANLDVQYIMAVAQNASTTYWSIDQNAQDIFLDWIVALSQASNPPLVHSISYGSIATENPQNDMYRFNTEVCQLGLRGLTVVVSSGDDGVANFEARNNASACGFNPSFPATSPYVTAVGATMGPESGSAEIACTSDAGGLITTGGGFSIFFPRPAYQEAAVTSYLQNGPNLPPTSLFNSNGRGYPDVAVLGHNYNVVIGGNTYVESGTSASAPVFAGMITLINDARLNGGKSPLGFLNYAIYQMATSSTGVFNDITQGENNCCAGQPQQQVCCQYGFTATTGWDPLTGFGSVNFVPLMKSLMQQ